MKLPYRTNHMTVNIRRHLLTSVLFGALWCWGAVAAEETTKSAGKEPAKEAAKETSKDNRVKLHIKASDPNGGKLSFKWVQIDGPEAKILDAAATRFDDNSKKWLSDTYFIPTKAGNYTFQVTVRNEDGLETKKTYVLEAKKGSE